MPPVFLTPEERKYLATRLGRQVWAEAINHPVASSLVEKAYIKRVGRRAQDAAGQHDWYIWTELGREIIREATS